MRKLILSSAAVMILFAFGIFSTGIATAGGPEGTVKTVLKDMMTGMALTNPECTVTHMDGSVNHLPKAENGSVFIMMSESGVLLCKVDAVIHGAKLSNHMGGTVNMVPYKLTVGHWEMPGAGLVGIPQQDGLVEAKEMGLDG